MVRFRKHPSHSSTTPDTTTYSKTQKNQSSATTASSYFVTNVIFISFALALTLLLSAFIYVEEEQAEQHLHHRETINQKQQQQLNNNNPISSSLRNFKNEQQKTTINYVTVVLPSVVNPKGRLQRLESISSTWGPSSHALYVIHSASEFPNVTTTTTTTTYPQPLLIPPSITIDDGVPRLQYVIRSIVTLHNTTTTTTTTTPSPPIDYAFFVNDHTFVIPSHLLHYLSKIKSPNDPLYAGHALKNSHDPFMFNSGAAGYVLSRRSMTDLVREWDESSTSSKCLVKKLSKWLQGNPGLVSAQCLSEVVGAPPVDTRDTEGGGGHVFHAFGLVRTVLGRVDDWYVNKHKLLDFMPEGLEDEKLLLPSGAKCCSKRTVSFHYVEAKENVAFYEILKIVAGSRTRLTDDEIRKEMLSKWPARQKELGFYSMGLPEVEDKMAWKDLVHVVRGIAEGFYEYEG